LQIPRRLVVSGAAIVLVAGVGLGASMRLQSDATGSLHEDQPSTVFVCRNGVAMSVWSALAFNRLAAERGLPLRAASRAALPTYSEVPLRMRLALVLDGFSIGDYRPRLIRSEDIQRADRIALIDTALPASVLLGDTQIESWSGFACESTLSSAGHIRILAAYEGDSGRPGQQWAGS
jgi:hypothetical protein